MSVINTMKVWVLYTLLVAHLICTSAQPPNNDQTIYIDGVAMEIAPGARFSGLIILKNPDGSVAAVITPWEVKQALAHPGSTTAPKDVDITIVLGQDSKMGGITTITNADGRGVAVSDGGKVSVLPGSAQAGQADTKIILGKGATLSGFTTITTLGGNAMTVSGKGDVVVSNGGGSGGDAHTVINIGDGATLQGQTTIYTKGGDGTKVTFGKNAGRVKVFLDDSGSGGTASTTLDLGSNVVLGEGGNGKITLKNVMNSIYNPDVINKDSTLSHLTLSSRGGNAGALNIDNTDTKNTVNTAAASTGKIVPTSTSADSTSLPASQSNGDMVTNTKTVAKNTAADKTDTMISNMPNIDIPEDVANFITHMNGVAQTATDTTSKSGRKMGP